jgi:hypothetical protein
MEGLLLISAKDNVGIALRALAAGGTLTLGGRTLTLQQPVKLGDKVAARDLAAGEIILKYGVPIGSATRAIKAGEHVHLHNMKSDYIPTYTLEDKHRFIPQGH